MRSTAFSRRLRLVPSRPRWSPGRVHEYLAQAEAKIHEAQVTAAEERVRAGAARTKQKLALALVAVAVVGLAASLLFWRDATESARSEKQAAQSERHARELADLARDAAQANLDNFNRLSHVVRLETAKAMESDLYPAWPEKSDAMRSWLAKEAKELTDALPELRTTLSDLESEVSPWSKEEQAAARAEHPRAAELEALESKLSALQQSRNVRTGTTQPTAFALDEAALAKRHTELNELAWPLVDPDREAFGREAEGLALARRAVSVAPESGDERAMVSDTLAWALFANGLDEEALASSEAALAAAPAAKQAEYTAYVTKLEAAIRAAGGEAGQEALESLSREVAALDAEVSARTEWRFEDDADAFLHSTLGQLVTDIEAFEQREVAAVRTRLTWSEQVEELTITRHEERWNEARLAILKADGVTASELYGEMPIELTPQMGLVPLGKNPVTKLWEFYHLRSAWDGKLGPCGASRFPSTIAEDGSIEVSG